MGMETWREIKREMEGGAELGIQVMEVVMVPFLLVQSLSPVL